MVHKVGFAIVYGKQATNPWSRFFLEKLTDAILVASKTIKRLGVRTTYCKDNSYYLASAKKCYTGIYERSCKSNYTASRNECRTLYMTLVKSREKK